MPVGMQQQLGMATAKVEVGKLVQHLVLPASISWDQRSLHTISARADGIIDSLKVRAPFTQVNKGDLLAKWIAPAWNSAAQEYLALSHTQSEISKTLRKAAKQRLLNLGMSEQQVRALQAGNNRIPLYAPKDSVVQQLMVREGQQVSAGTPILTLGQLDSVWVQASVPQYAALNLKVGSPVKINLPAQPDTTYQGTIDAWLPEIDAVTRSRQVRITVDNPQHQLLPGMLAEVVLHNESAEQRPLIPIGALINTGQETRVAIALGEGHFQVVPVRIGASTHTQVEVLEGLKGGEQIVTSGQFLIDSEASLASGAGGDMHAHHGH